MKAGRVALAVCAVGSLGAVAGGVALANGGQNAAASARPATRGTSGARTESASLLTGYGRGSGFARSTCGAGVAGQVTSVSGNTINLTGRRAGAVAVTVGATTVYTEAQQAASLADVHTGLLIMACGTGSSTNVQATKIYIVLPRIGGVVTNVSGSTLTLTSLDGATRTVTVSNATTYDKAGHSASLGDITNGTAIAAQGSVGSDGVLSADIQTPRVAGQVMGVNGSTITLSNAHGMNGMSGVNGTSGMSGTTTVVTSDQATYSVISATAGMTPTTTTGMAGDVKTGVSIIAQGTLSSDGKTLDALRITILPASANGRAYARHGRHGSFGRGFGGFGGPGGSQGPRGGFSRGFGSGGFNGSGSNTTGASGWGSSGHSYTRGWNGDAPNSGATVGTANA